MTDQQLIDLYFARDEGAVAETERKYGAYCRAISRSLRTRKPGARTAFLRRYWYAEGVAQVADGLGWSVSKTKSSLMRTRNRLRAYLEEEGLR